MINVPSGFLSAIVFCLSLSAYILTLAPSVLWGEDAKFQRMAYFRIIEANEWGHPLWVFIANCFTMIPVGDSAYRVNLSSALFSAGALTILYLLLREITGSKASALIGTTALAVSHTFWLFAVRGKGVYSLNSLFMLAIIFLLLRSLRATEAKPLWKPALAAILFAIGLGNHVIFAALGPGLVVLFALVYLKNPKNPMPLLLSLAAFFLGILPFVILTVQSGEAPRLTQLGTGVINRILGIQNTTREIRDLILYFTYQFPSPAILFGLIGIIVGFKTRRWLGFALLLFTLTVIILNFNFDVPDKFQYFLPAYLIFAVWIGLGADWCIGSLRKITSGRTYNVAILLTVILVVVMPVYIYSVAPALAGRFNMVPEAGRDLPGRDVLSFHLTPSKHGYFGARDFGEQVFLILPPNAAIIADYTPAQTLKYLQSVEGQRPDVEIAELYTSEQLDFVLANKDRVIYLAHTERYYDIESISRHFEILPEGPIFRLIPREPTITGSPGPVKR